jgi:hypothetical protein
VLINAEGDAKLVDFDISHCLEDVWVRTRRQGTDACWAPEVTIERSGGHPNYLRLLGGVYLRMGCLN